MKKTAIIAAVVLLCISFAAAGWGAGATYNGYPVVNVTVNGQPVTSDVPAIVMDGRTLLPVAAVADALGMVAKYDVGTNTVTLNHNKKKEFDNRNYEIKSDNLVTNSGQHLCFVIDGEIYIPVNVFAKYYCGFDELEVTYDLPHTGFITVTAKKIQGHGYINPKDLGLKVNLQDNVLWVNL